MRCRVPWTLWSRWSKTAIAIRWSVRRPSRPRRHWTGRQVGRADAHQGRSRMEASARSGHRAGRHGPGAKSALETLKEVAANKKNKKDKAFKQAVKEAVKKINAR